MSVIGRNMVWLFVSQILTWMISVVLLVVAPRRLGPADFGLLNFVAAFIGFFAFVGLLGTGPFILRSVARDPNLLTPYVVNAVVMKIIVATVLGVIALGLGALLGYSGTTLALIGISVIGLYFLLINDVVTSGLAGLNRMARPAMWLVVQTYLTAGLALIVLVTNRSVVAYSFVIMIGGLVPLIANSRSMWRLLVRPLHIDTRLWRKLVRGGVPMLMLSGLILVYGTIDIPLLEALTNSTVVGEYALAYRWVGIPVFVATIVVSAVSPSLSAFAHQSDEQFAELANRSLRTVLAVSIPAATGIFIVAYDLMDLLYHDQGFESSALLMRILAVHIPLAAISTVLGAILIASDRQNKYVYVALIAAILNPPITIGLIVLTKNLADNGAIGAAISTVATEMFMVTGAFFIRRAGVFDRATAKFGLRVIFANVAMAIPLVVLDDLELFLKVGLGIVLYVLASLAFRTFKPSDLRTGLDQLRSARRGPSIDYPEVSEDVVPDR